MSEREPGQMRLRLDDVSVKGDRARFLIALNSQYAKRAGLSREEMSVLFWDEYRLSNRAFPR